MKPTNKISSVCRECGLAANTLTCLVRYGNLPKRPAFSVSTFRKGVCDCCGRQTHITEARDFFYPDFSLINRGEFAQKLKNKEAKNDTANHS